MVACSVEESVERKHVIWDVKTPDAECTGGIMTRSDRIRLGIR